VCAPFVWTVMVVGLRRILCRRTGLLKTDIMVDSLSSTRTQKRGMVSSVGCANENPWKTPGSGTVPVSLGGESGRSCTIAALPLLVALVVGQRWA
jgi:hypothetical protein